jgi:crotonobetainyl-CoA:carnitine CoA-transferase CaiB-like acyl-CoA transferase
VHGITPRLSVTPGIFRYPAPELGQDTRPILEELGFSASEIDRLERDGVIDRGI